MKNICRLLILIICLFFLYPCFASAADFEENAYLSGQVKDSLTGTPIPDARIVLICGSVRVKTSTDFQGYYEFSEIPIYSENGNLLNSASIKVSAKEYISVMENKDLLPGQSTLADFMLGTRFTFPVIRGKVIDALSQQSIANSTITAASDNEVFSATTDSNGQYILRIGSKKVKEYSIIAAASSYHESQPEVIRIFPHNDYIVDFSLDLIGLGIGVSPDNWPIGNLGLNSIATMTQGQQIIVTNSGNENQTYSLMVVSPEGWTASDTNVEAEKYMLNACFSSDVNNISWSEQNHALLDILQRCNDIKFAADQTGVNIIQQPDICIKQ